MFEQGDACPSPHIDEDGVEAYIRDIFEYDNNENPDNYFDDDSIN